MADKDRYRMGIEVSAKVKSSATTHMPVTDASTPFCIAVLGDFSGRENNRLYEPETIASRRLITVDRDNFEEVMAAFDIRLNIGLQENDGVTIKLNELDDFHPDTIYENLETFSKLRSLRRRLKNNSSFADAAAEMQGWLPAATHVETVSKETASAEVTNNTPTDNLLDSILSSQQTVQAEVATASAIDKLIKEIVAPYVEPAADPRQDEMIASLDRATEKHMRDLLHHGDFQAMEAAWQSLYFLIKRLDTGSKLKIYLLDISKRELQADLVVDDVATSAVYKLFCDPVKNDTQWSLLLGNYSFSDTVDDALSLVGIGEIAQKASAPFLAAASETLAGCQSFAKTPVADDWNYVLNDGVSQAWQRVRQSPLAAYLGLAMPRFLLRLPYGRKSKPIEAFAFEEMPEQHCHACYLWGNAAFVKAEALARNFTDNGWRMSPCEVHQTDNLPVHYYEEEGETVNKPVAEILLTESGGKRIADQGLMALWSVKNTDSIRSADYCSLSAGGEQLKGRWL
ncbi:MAG: type VI secretion system contractile sheath large subunit [Gammaproteobacteria bacterium]|nr:type VI secretion system contractile sheath large subunit [Gammaproteobacteria bacterium]